MRFRIPWPRSLIMRLTLGYMLAHAVAMTLFFTFLYPFAVGNGEEHAAPKLALTLLAKEIVPANGGVSLRKNGEVDALAKANPRFWFVAKKGEQQVRFGPVPPNLPPDLMRPGIVDSANLDSLGAAGRVGEASFDTIDTRAGRMIAGVGGIDPRTVPFAQWMRHYYDEVFWLQIFTTLFTLAGALVAIPILLQSIRPTVCAASLISPARLDRRLPEQNVVRELMPLVTAFNAALDRLADAFEARRRFIADVAHELRTPLAVLSMRVDALTGSSKTEIERILYRLNQMVGQMLDVERLAAVGRRRDPVDLVEIARAAAAEIAPLAMSNGYEIAFDSPKHSVIVEGDAHAIGRAVSNLLGNAVAYGGQAGTITVRVGPEGTIDIADEGRGIPAEARDRIFEPFHRERWDMDGCGLGLHLVRQIMRGHGGDAFVLHSEPGTVFRLDFGRASLGTPTIVLSYSP